MESDTNVDLTRESGREFDYKLRKGKPFMTP